jgi:hypothetical protein
LIGDAFAPQGTATDHSGKHGALSEPVLPRCDVKHRGYSSCAATPFWQRFASRTLPVGEKCGRRLQAFFRVLGRGDVSGMERCVFKGMTRVSNGKTQACPRPPRAGDALSAQRSLVALVARESDAGLRATVVLKTV